MKRVAADKHNPIIAIPEIVRPAIVAIEPRIIVIPFNIEHVEIAVQVGNI